MKTKFLLPVLAMIIAVGMSFTTLNKVGDPSTDYILEDGVFQPLGTEFDCKMGSVVCTVRIGNSQPYDLYDDDDISSKKIGAGTQFQL